MDEQNKAAQKERSPAGKKETSSPRLSRRGFLQVAGASAVVAATGGTVLAASERDQAAVQDAESIPAAGSGQAPAAAPASATAGTSQPLQETWLEPWVWRPEVWNGQQLPLHVVENQNPGPAIGLGNIGASLFSYGGIAPGPTIRMRGDETLFVKLRNFLGKDYGTSYVREFPDPGPLTDEMVAAAEEQAQKRDQLRLDFCIGEHTNGIHSNHVTNLHTHGLHVRPGRNPDGTQSDNIILRVMSHGDWRARQESDDLDCRFLLEREQVGEADYEFRLGDVMGDPDAPHPPGTHWYHPHSHGATHNQVSSGMAGFLIIEGDVDDVINERMTGERNPDPAIKSGDWDYRERLMLMQRVSVNPSTDKDAPPGEPDLKTPDTPNVPTINGSNQPKTILMRPGAVERWRVLNGSVDGRGFKRFMVLEGEFATENDILKRRDPKSGELLPLKPDDIAAAKQQLYQLSMDGVTLVAEDGRYFIKDLADQNPDAEQLSPAEEETAGEALAALRACFKDAQSVTDCYLRPNEVYMAPANRTDLFFQAPHDGGGRIYTILAKAVVVHADNYQSKLEGGTLPPPPGDIILAYVHVPEEDAAPAFDVMSLIDVLPDAPHYLQPVAEEELRVSDVEVDGRDDVQADDLRTRTLSYSGWGAADFPLTTVDPAFVEANPELLHLTYAPVDGPGNVHYLLAPQTRTMAINAQFDLSPPSTSSPSTSSGGGVHGEGDAEPVEAPPPRKFDPTDPNMAQMLVDTAEEWAIFNNSITLWGDAEQKPYGVNTKANKIGYPMTRAEAGERGLQIVSKAVDHPFHIHINPFYLLRIEVPDENGNLVNVLPEPRWQDVVWLPRNGGRVVFRSRFADFVGQYVHHCHILLHEDNGMMHVVQTTQYVADSNYVPKSAVPPIGASEEAVNAVFPRPSLAQSYLQSISFVDPNPETGQTFPGFEVVVPEYDNGE